MNDTSLLMKNRREKEYPILEVARKVMLEAIQQYLSMQIGQQ